MPGRGTGYLPWALATTGAADSVVNLSAPGAISCSQLSMSSKEIARPVWAAMRPIEVTTLASTPRFTSL